MLADKALGERTPRSGLKLARITATHVRVGDKVFSNADWAVHGWRHSDDLRDNPFLRHPVLASM